ncbi:MAG: cytochrome c oxidase subunit 3 [Flavobacteriaceae bacterium]
MMTELQNRRTKKMMLWFGMISIAMTFAGLTSAYVVSSTRADWITNFNMPQPFYYSTVLILLSSGTFFWAERALKSNTLSQAKLGVWTTLTLALVFIYTQFQGFQAIIDQGYYFTGAESTITTSFLYVLVLLHLTHLTAGILVLLIVLIRLYSGAYTAEKSLGMELAVLFWHFLDFLWLYLFCFVLFYR